MPNAGQKVTRADIRRAMAESGGDLRAVGERFGMGSREILMILAYDVTITTTNEKTSSTASGVFDALDDER